jgi:hypothetical protein
MKYTTYVCGNIDISGLPRVNKMQIRNYLEEIYSMQQLADIYSEEEITINDEWEDFDTSEKFLIAIFKISRFLDKDTKALIMCNGERDGDMWAIIIKANKVFTQRFELKPEGEMEEYEKVKS